MRVELLGRIVMLLLIVISVASAWSDQYDKACYSLIIALWIRLTVVNTGAER